MWTGKSRSIVGLVSVVLCFWASTIQAVEQGGLYGWGGVSGSESFPPPGNDFVAVAAGARHGLAIRSDGSLVGWGDDDYGQATVPGGNDFVAIAAGRDHSLALKLDGSIVGWGRDDDGQATVPVGNDFVAIAAGGYHSLALKSDGSLVGWGRDDDGQATAPVGNDFVAISAGYEHSLAIKSDGSLVGWGRDDDGQATVPVGNDFVAISAGGYHSLALKSDGSLVGWGCNDGYQATVPLGNDFVAVSAGYEHGLALKSDGSTVEWGVDGNLESPPAGSGFFAIAAGLMYNLAINSDVSLVGWGDNYYHQAMVPVGNDFVAISAGRYHSLALRLDGSIVGWGVEWGDYDYGQASSPGGNDFVAVAAGGYHSLALKSDGSIVGWGANTDYDGVYYGQATPPGGNDFVAIAAGEEHSLALKSDGSIAGWGKDNLGQATVPGGSDFVAISAGEQHNLALKSDGSLVGWGDDYYGQATVPVGNDFVAIAAGGMHSLALKSDGSLVGWGYDHYGQATVPVGNDFVAIAAGGLHSLALKSDGSIVGWGSDGSGRATPPAGNDFVAISAGYLHSLAIREVREVQVDINTDGQVDLADFGIVSAGWMEAGCNGGNDFCSGADIDRMGDVGLDDLLILAERWLEGVCFPTAAFGPAPTDGASGVNPDTQLSWSVGNCAVSHNIYFGTSSPGEFQCNQTGTTFDPGLLDCGTTYYWRIDEVQGDSSVIEGDVWRFTTIPPGPAFGPAPDDGRSGVNTDAKLSWSAGNCAVSHNIYFGTSSPGEFQGNQTETTFDPGALELETMYYWRVDEVQADSSVIEGDVWSFTTRSDMLVGWWELDESEGGTAYDSSANGYNGTLNGDPTWRPGGGRIGGALEFDGVGDYVEIEGYKGISGSNPRTVTAWVSVEPNASTLSIVRWGTSNISGATWSNVINADGKLRAAVVGGSVVGDTAIDDDTWHHVAIVLPDKEDVKVEDILLYVDGMQEDTTISFGSQAIDTIVGMDVLISEGGSFDGLLDDVRIYNYALSEGEIGALAGVL